MKIIDIVNSQPVMQKIVNHELPLDVAHKLTKNITELEAVLKLFNTKRETLNEEYVDQSDAENPVVPDDKVSEYNDKMEGILSEEVEISLIKIPSDKLEGLKISAAELRMVDWLITFED